MDSISFYFVVVFPDGKMANPAHHGAKTPDLGKIDPADLSYQCVRGFLTFEIPADTEPVATEFTVVNTYRWTLPGQ